MKGVSKASGRKRLCGKWKQNNYYITTRVRHARVGSRGAHAEAVRSRCARYRAVAHKSASRLTGPIYRQNGSLCAVQCSSPHCAPVESELGCCCFGGAGWLVDELQRAFVATGTHRAARRTTAALVFGTMARNMAVGTGLGVVTGESVAEGEFGR